MYLADISYTSDRGTHRTLDLHVHADDTSTKPLIVFVHGGAWIAGDKAVHKELAARISAATGCAVAVPNYSLSPQKLPDGGASLQHPAHADDVLAAFEFLATWDGATPDNASTESARPPYYDAATIFAIGHSCGAHILGSIFLAPSQSPSPQVAPSQSLLRAVRGIVTTEGIFDVDLLLQSFPSYRSWFIEFAFGPRSDYRDVSLAHFDKRSAEIAWLLVHSTGDTLVDRLQASVMYDRLQQLYGPDSSAVSKDWDSIDQEHDDVLESPKLLALIREFVTTRSP